jgi:acyl dehydratase
MSAPPTTTAQCFFEDVEVNVFLETPAMTLTRAHVALFTGITGEPLPAELDSVPAILPLCLSSGLGWRVPQPPLAVLAFMGFEWRFLAPVRIGDTIHSRSRTLAKRSMREGGVVIEERSIINQRNETVQEGRLTLLVARRPAP